MMIFLTSSLSDALINTNIVPLEPSNLIQSIISFASALIFGYLISKSYKFSTQSLSGGRQVASSILPLTLTVCLIITVVKSSLALSLGLVGALSIVRFRTPIKDPEDLVYLFLSIVCGLGFGANRNLYTIFGVTAILIILNSRAFIRTKAKKKLNSFSEYNINLDWEINESLSLEKIVDLISLDCNKVSFIRLDRSPKRSNLVIQIRLFDEAKIEQIVEKLTSYNNNLSIQIFSSDIDW